MQAFIRFYEPLFFLQRFLHHPSNVGSIWPSSRYLRDKMFRGVERGAGDVVLELGPVTGSFTRKVEQLRHEGIDIRY
jgi:phospholipid N-methyltransferase